MCADAFRRCGLSAAHASIGADVLSTTDAWGVFTHGSKGLRGYVRRLQAGGLVARAEPEVVAEGSSWAVVDGHSALAMVTSLYGVQLAVAKARTTGIAYVGVRNSSHFGAAGYYAWRAADAGLVGLSMANDIPSVAAPGSRAAVTGSNPFAYAVPAGKYRPIILDISVATVAGGKVYAARERGESIPPGWLIDKDGRPTDDASTYPETSTLTPAAGHKGYGLALLVETLAAAVSGAAITAQVGSWLAPDGSRPTGHGAAFIVLDVAAISAGSQFEQRIEAMIDEIHGAPTAPEVENVYVPGEQEWRRFDEAERRGVTLPSDVMASLTEAADLVGLDLTAYLDQPRARS